MLPGQTQTEDGHLIDTNWLQLYMQDEQLALTALNDQLLSQIEQLISVFYAYSRSESKIDEKEEQMQAVITQKDTELGSLQQLLTEAQGANREFKDRINAYQAQVSQLQQSA